MQILIPLIFFNIVFKSKSKLFSDISYFDLNSNIDSLNGHYAKVNNAENLYDIGNASQV